LPQVAALTLANGEATPVNHTFAPLGQDTKTGIWWFEDQSPRVTASSTLGYPRIGILTKRETDQVQGQSARNTVSRVQLLIALPQLETLGTSSSGFTPAPTIAYVDRVKIEFIQSSRNSLADRKDSQAYAKSLLAHATVTDLVQNLTAMY
jgi:hypothetical protein